MHLKVNRLLAALLAAGVTAAYAQPVVPPPKPAGAAMPAPTQQPANTPAAAATQVAPAVLPPATTSSLNPAASAPAAPSESFFPGDLIDIALPSAPKPEPARVLTPQAPKAAAPTASAKSSKATDDKKGKPEKEAVAEKPKKPLDPFSGLVGTPVSDSQLNRFVFPEPIEGVYFQEGAPLPECPADAAPQDPCKPVFLNGKRMMLLQMRAGAKGPVQMLTHLHSGRIVTLNLMPSPGPGAIIRVDGAEDGASDARLAKATSPAGVAQGAGGMTASEQNVELLSRIARGDLPAGFEPVNVSGRPVRFELFDVIQMASWDNEAGLRAHMFQIVAHTATPVAISPALFRHETVQALALDRETITNAEPAILFMLERVEGEAQ